MIRGFFNIGLYPVPCSFSLEVAAKFDFYYRIMAISGV